MVSGMNPLVSIVIPVYNGANYVAEAIESALAQTYDNIEILVINDGSIDNGETDRAVERYRDKIRYFKKENGGSSSALNCGIQNMSGEWFSWLSHDDLYYPDKIQRQIEYLNSMDLSANELPDHIFFSASDLIDGNGQTIRKADPKKVQKTAALIDALSGNECLIAEPTRYNFHGCSCLIHRDAFERVGLFDEKLRLLNDIDMWYRLYSAGFKLHYLTESLVKGRVHAKQISRSIGYSYHNPEQDWFWDRSLKWLKENHPNRDELFHLFGRNAYLKTRTGDGDRAFAIVAELKPEKKLQLQLQRMGYILYAKGRTFAKNMYLKLRA